ncbi:tRNA/rRNA methyltransferase [Spiroplasma syrphidicola EA-1]|uniref:tRNA/rRNA methyltransferase n=1 Tax=Spiroplasma syrphidicola EA-1 TaxID=1276229 RepID=R4UHZ8_9MOLU|nr:23S rRNA (guanosine(2251)-2'-O)-methyltransferase RlmB [Spiroplasma syrphidicola]AGM25765.1 tRNA/rRNA methyltransferase [Spiroplasma syrphidicola EA-1]
MKEYLYIYGINPVVESLQNDKIFVVELYAVKTSNENETILSLAKKRHLKINYCSKEQLTKLANSNNHQNYLLAIKMPKPVAIEQLVDQSLQNPHPFLLVLDQVVDPQNFGAILRTCDMFNVDGVIILNKRQVSLTPSAVKASAGGFAHVAISEVNNLTNAIEYLKTKGFWIYATELSAKAAPVGDLKYDTPVCLIVGNEGKGVSPKLLKHADFNVYVPTAGHLDSLNVSVATAVLIYQIKMLQQEL